MDDGFAPDGTLRMLTRYVIWTSIALDRAGELSTIDFDSERASMKNIISIFLLLIASNSSFGQSDIPFPTVDGRINFSEVVTVEDANKGELYARAKLWFANSFDSSNHVIQLDDKDNGIVLGKGKISEKNSGGKKTWEFTVKIQLKEGRYKADIYDIYYKFEKDLSGVSPSVRKILEPESVTYFDLDSRYADRSSKKSMYDKSGSLKEGFATNLASWTNERFTSLLASIRKQLSEGVAMDEF